MFRRRWCGLPKDASFTSDLKKLGYFVNDDDEIRSVENPDNYYHFFIDKNERINERQKFHFNQALQDVIHDRLKKLGLDKIRLPLGTSTSAPHVPIFATKNPTTHKRIVVIFGETRQDLGVIAGRVANGRGGVAQGSMISVVQALQSQADAPAVLLANTGQTYWWPEEKKALTLEASVGIEMPSLVHQGRRYLKDVNAIPENEDAAAHLEYVMKAVLPRMMAEGAKVDVIAVGECCEIVQTFFDKEDNWDTWQKRLGGILLMGTVYPSNLKNASFESFMAKRARAYIISDEPIDTPLAPPTGNPNLSIPALGCPCYSSAEPHYLEMILIQALKPALAYLDNIAADPSYENELIEVTERKAIEPEEVEVDWENLYEGKKPMLSVVSEEMIEEQKVQGKLWEEFERTGGVMEGSGDEGDGQGELP